MQQTLAAPARLASVGAERELEIRVGLGAEGFRKLLNAGGWSEAKNREDCYFDAFDGRGWTWKSAREPWKLRLKRKSKGIEAQLRHVVEHPATLASDLPLLATVWEFWESPLGDRQAATVWSPAADLLRRLRQGAIQSMQDLREMDGGWRGLTWAGSDALRLASRSLPGVLLPSHSALKSRRERRETFSSGWTGDVVIGRSLTSDASGAESDRYEVEISPVQATQDIPRAVHEVSDWLKRLGIVSEDVPASLPDPMEAAVRLYAQVPGVLSPSR
jgi:hypothetical protein